MKHREGRSVHQHGAEYLHAHGPADGAKRAWRCSARSWFGAVIAIALPGLTGCATTIQNGFVVRGSELSPDEIRQVAVIVKPFPPQT